MSEGKGASPEGPWRIWWQGSGPKRGDHVMCGRDEIAYFPAIEGTDGAHAAVERIVYEHNCAVARREGQNEPTRHAG